MFNKVGERKPPTIKQPPTMKATEKQIALLRKLHNHYNNVDLSALDIKYASKLISTLIEMKKCPWNIKRQIYLSDVFYDLEEEAFGEQLTPAESWR